MVYGNIMRMTRTTVYLPLDLQRELRDESRRSGVPQAELIRAAVTSFLNGRVRPAPRSIGSGQSADGLSARDSEAWLRDAWDKTR
jgi:hypothetical protein